MKWVLKEMEVGDMVRVPMKEAYHYGVCTGEDRIIQFGEPVLTVPKPKDEIRVMSTNIASFLNGQFAEVAELDKKELKRRKPIEDIVAYAEQSIGKGGYDILYNNCEHFANECLFGLHVSSQIDEIRQKIEAKMPCINVYIGAVEDFCNTNELPKYARKELKKISSEKVAKEKKAGYGLLVLAAREMTKNPDVKKCFLGKTGKPLHKDFGFSITHSDGLVAVAAAPVAVGIDLEGYADQERQEKLLERILHQNEQADDPILLWTVKEAAFKFSEEDKHFRPAQIDANGFKSRSVAFTYDGKRYVLSVVANVVANVHFYCKLKNCELEFENVKTDFRKK